MSGVIPPFPYAFMAWC